MASILLRGGLDGHFKWEDDKSSHYGNEDSKKTKDDDVAGGDAA